MQTPQFFEGIVAEDPASELGLGADEPQTGRVLVREILGHSNRVSSENLVPAYIVMPTISAGVGGVGLSPTGLLKGTRVMCMKFPDQASKYKAKYPYNHTMTTRGGHLVEFDDTPGSERIQVYHKTGSYLEILPDGSIVTKSVKDHIQLAAGNMTIFNVGNEKGDQNIEITCNQGKITITAQSDVDIYANEGNVGIYANNGSVQIVSKSGVVDILSPLIGLNA